MNKTFRGITGAAIFALALACATGPAQAKSRATDKKTSATEQVWAKEKAYWRYVKGHDVKDYLALWSKDFMGWPISAEHPAGKDSLRKVLKSSGVGLGHVVAYKLQRESVRQHGPVVITYYLVSVTRGEANGSRSTTTYRLSHTWLREHGVWLIVGGMSTVNPPAK